MKNSIKKILVSILVCSQLFNPTIVFALNKDESVYVKLDSDGKVNEVKVSEHLSNYSGSKFTEKMLMVMKSLVLKIIISLGKLMVMIFIIKELMIKNYLLMLK